MTESGEHPMGWKNASIGDIVEVVTPKGLAYLQYMHETRDFGELVRVLPGLHSSRPEDFAQLAGQKELYFIFYSLKSALRANQTEVVSNQPIPDWAKNVPFMRHAAGRDADGRVSGWRVIPALAELTIPFLQKTAIIKQLTSEQQNLSIHWLRSHPAMIEELARGWTPQKSEELDEQDRASAQAKSNEVRQKAAAPAENAVHHYLYFPEKSNAEKAARWFQSQGFSVETKPSGDGENWLTLVKHTAPQAAAEMDKLRDEIEALTFQLGGEYDGWEVALANRIKAGPNR